MKSTTVWLGVCPGSQLLRQTGIKRPLAMAVGQTLLCRQLEHSLLKIGDLRLSALEQIAQQTPFRRGFRVQWKVDPANLHIFFFLQAFNTNCTEITPGSDEVSEDLKDYIIVDHRCPTERVGVIARMPPLEGQRKPAKSTPQKLASSYWWPQQSVLLSSFNN
jgi:hypothetical protein